MMIRMRFAALTSTAVVALLAGCRADIFGTSRSIAISGGSDLIVGQAAVLTADSATVSDGTTAPVYTWSTSDSSVASVNTFMLSSNKANVVGRKAGEAVISVIAGGRSGEWRVTVQDQRAIVAIVNGDSITGRLANGVAQSRVALPLTAGDTVDLAVSADGAELSNLRIQSADNSLRLDRAVRSPRITIYGAVVAPRTATYLLDVAADVVCSHGSCRGEGPYTVRARRSAPILSLINGFAALTMAQGDVASDTGWIRNLGTGVLTVQLSGATGSWLRPDAGTVAAQGPIYPSTSGPTSLTGAVSFTSTVDARALKPGTYGDSVALDAPVDAWSTYIPSSHTLRFVTLHVFEPTTGILTRVSKLSHLAVLPDGRMFGATDDSVFAVDPQTGASTPLLGFAGVQAKFIARLVGGLDGSLYFNALTPRSDSIYKVVDGTATPLLGWQEGYSGGFTVLADGTIYVVHGAQIVRFSGGTATTLVAVDPNSSYPVLAYQPVEQAIYFASRRQLQRYDIARNVVEPRGAVGGLSDVLAIDPQGRLYARRPDRTALVVLDTQGRELDQIVPPCLTEIAITGGMIYGSCPGYFWRIPVR